MSLMHSKAVLELGQRLVDQLNVEDDLLASWMAHDIAHKIDVAEKATGEAKDGAHNVCAKAILDLWERRSALPDHLRPLGDVEPILRTLASLDMKRTDYRYFAPALREAETAKTDEDIKRWLDLAVGLDYTARLLIKFALKSAVDKAVIKTEPWVELALQVGEEPKAERALIEFYKNHVDEDQAAHDQKVCDIKDKIKKLETFNETVGEILVELNGELESIIGDA